MKPRDLEAVAVSYGILNGYVMYYSVLTVSREDTQEISNREGGLFASVTAILCIRSNERTIISVEFTFEQA